MTTKHALQVKVGIKEKQLNELKKELAVTPKSAVGEANKLAIRLLIGLVIGLAVKFVYQQLPILNDIEPDMQQVIDSLIVIGSIFVTTWIDKFEYQTAKNAGAVGAGVGIDGVIVKLGGLFDRKKTVIEEANTTKNK